MPALVCAVGLTVVAVGVGTGDPAGGPGSAAAPSRSLHSGSPATVPPAVVPAPPSSRVPGPAEPSGPDPRPVSPWQPPAPIGLTEPVEDVLADAPESGPIRIVALAEGPGGRPEITVTVAPDGRRAAAAVEDARQVDGVLAVALDSPVSVAAVDEPRPVHGAAAAPGIAAAAPETGAAAPGTGAAVAVAAQSNDAFRSQQWSLDVLRAETAWQRNTGTGQTVAVIDTGVAGDHPDLAGRVLPGLDLIEPGGDGRVDRNGHGTHIAGTIAAVAHNGQGIAGLAPDARILPVRVLLADGVGWGSNVANGIVWAVDHGATVLNLSLSGPGDAATAAAVRYALSRNVAVVAAGGNQRQAGNPVAYPAAYPGVLAVAATDRSGASATFSTMGSYLALAAPGVGILSTWPPSLGSYAYLSGTSMAAPHAAAAVALIRAAHPGLTAEQAAAALVASARDLGVAGRDAEFGAGLLDPVGALEQQAAAGPVRAPEGAGSWFYLDDANSGRANTVFSYGDPGDEVLVADTDGRGGDSLLVRRGNQYFVRNSLSSGVAEQTFVYGDPPDTVLVGDWNGDGVDTLAVRRGNAYFIKNSTSSGVADAVVFYGDPGDTVLVGDWNGDGVDTLAVRRGAQYFIKNAMSTGVADAVVVYGEPTDAVLAGRWDGRSAGLAVRRGITFYLKYGLTTGVADVVFGYGNPGDIVLVGDWNGDGVDTVGVRRSS